MYKTKLKDLFFTAFDFETTGLYPDSDRIVEIGAVKFNLAGEEYRYSGLINPGMKMPEQASQVNGITDDMLEDMPVEDDIIPGFIDFIDGTVLVAHNIGFDAGFLKSAAVRLDLRLSDLPCIDTLNLTRNLLRGLPSYKLGVVAAFLRIDIENAHRAEDDAVACMDIFKACLEKLPGHHELELGDFFKKSGGRAKSLSRSR